MKKWKWLIRSQMWHTRKILTWEIMDFQKFLLCILLEVSKVNANIKFCHKLLEIDLIFNIFLIYLEHDNSVDALAANPQNAKEFATGSHDRTVKIWDAPTFKCKGTIKGHEKGVWSLSYDSSGKKLLTSSPDFSARIWDTKTGKQTAILNNHTLFVS